MGIWKVRSLHACRKVQKLTQELKCYRGVILGLAEIRWTGFGGTVTDEGHKIWYCGEDSKHQDGVARKEVVGSVIGCTPMSSRLISILISARPYNNTVIQVYAPTSHHDDEEVEQFEKQLVNIIAKTPKKDILVVQSDWNAKVGPDAYQH